MVQLEERPPRKREAEGSHSGHTKCFEIVLFPLSLGLQYYEDITRHLSNETLKQGPIYQRFTQSMSKNKMVILKKE